MSVSGNSPQILSAAPPKLARIAAPGNPMKKLRLLSGATELMDHGSGSLWLRFCVWLHAGRCRKVAQLSRHIKTSCKSVAAVIALLSVVHSRGADELSCWGIDYFETIVVFFVKLPKVKRKVWGRPGLRVNFGDSEHTIFESSKPHERLVEHHRTVSINIVFKNDRRVIRAKNGNELCNHKINLIHRSKCSVFVKSAFGSLKRNSTCLPRPCMLIERNRVSGSECWIERTF